MGGFGGGAGPSKLMHITLIISITYRQYTRIERTPPPNLLLLHYIFIYFATPPPLTYMNLRPITRKQSILNQQDVFMKTQIPPIMNKSKDVQDHKNNFLKPVESRYCHKK